MKSKMSLQVCLGAALVFALPSWAVETGLSQGSEFSATPVHGSLSVDCQDSSGQDFANYDCSDVILEPTDNDYFVTQPGGHAAQFELRAVHEDGSVQKKNGDFDPTRGRSKSSINLWIATLFQRPLLNMGTNRISYQLKNGSVTEKSGEFDVHVRQGKERVCPHDFVNSPTLDDCRSSANVCDNYLWRFNYCR